MFNNHIKINIFADNEYRIMFYLSMSCRDQFVKYNNSIRVFANLYHNIHNL